MICPSCRGAREVRMDGVCADDKCPRRGTPHAKHRRCDACLGHGALGDHKTGCNGSPCFCGRSVEANQDLFAPEALYPPGWEPPRAQLGSAPAMVDMPEGQAE